MGRGGEGGGSYETTNHLKHHIMMLIVPPQTHSHREVVENMEQSMSCSVAECTHISGLLALQVKVGIGRKLCLGRH